MNIHKSTYIRYDVRAMNTNTLFTVGYEGLNLSQFLNMLERYGIEKIIDVRAVPISRKPGFSKTALRNALTERGLLYTHFVSLGCPKPVRDAYKVNNDWREYTRGFKAYLQTQTAAMEEIAALMQQHTCALLCFEADANFCHRSLIAADMIRRFGIKVTHADVVAAKTTQTAKVWQPALAFV